MTGQLSLPQTHSPFFLRPVLLFSPSQSILPRVTLLSLVLRTLGNHSNRQQVAQDIGVTLSPAACLRMSDIKTEIIKSCF